MDFLETQDKTDEGRVNMVRLCYTSETHSYVFPYDFVKGRPEATGYMALSSAFCDDAIIIDGGDVLQGSPLARFESKQGKSLLYSARAFNAAGLDVFVPGNHDFDFGYERLFSFVSSLDASFVCANLADEKGLLDVKPYVIIEKNRERVLITGAVTDYVNVWDKTKLEGLRITDSLSSLNRVMAETEDLDVDYKVCVYHGGFSRSEKGILRENRAYEIASLGFDVLLTAHQHEIIPPYMEGHTLTLQAGSKASLYALVTLEKGKEPCAEIRKPVPPEMLSEKMKNLFESDDTFNDLRTYLEQRAGSVDGSLEDRSRIHSFLYGSSLADYINDLQLSISGAEVSAASLFNNPVSLSGNVSMLDILTAYPFSNTLAVFSITAAQLRLALERSACFADFSDGRVIESPLFSPGKDERYNYDFYRGIAYSFDLARKPGCRVVRLEIKGEDLLENPDRKLRIVLNSYRSSGTGGYDVYKDAELLENISTDIQDALIDSFQSGAVKVPEKTDFQVLYDGQKL